MREGDSGVIMFSAGSDQAVHLWKVGGEGGGGVVGGGRRRVGLVDSRGEEVSVAEGSWSELRLARSDSSSTILISVARRFSHRSTRYLWVVAFLLLVVPLPLSTSRRALTRG